MSADRPDPEQFVDDRHDHADRDPHGIVPDGFCQRYGTTSVLEALRKAEDDATKTNAAEFPRCPECDSTRLRKKSGNVEMSHKRDTAYKCTGCGHHFDEPKEPLEEEWPGEQVTLREGVRHGDD